MHLEEVPVIVRPAGNHPNLVVIQTVYQADEPTRLCTILLRHSRNVPNENRVENLENKIIWKRKSGSTWVILR